LDRWDIGYGSLTDVGANHQNGILSEILFRPDAGWNVVLNSFDLGWTDTSPDQIVRVINDVTGAVLWDVSPYLGTDAAHTFMPAVVSADAIRLQFGSRNLAIDNLNFSELPVSPVPEPGTLAVVVNGLAGAGIQAMRRFRRRRSNLL
jgi:hypothetical protein